MLTALACHHSGFVKWENVWFSNWVVKDVKIAECPQMLPRAVLCVGWNSFLEKQECPSIMQLGQSPRQDAGARCFKFGLLNALCR